jgi:6-phosphogluconolactonase
MAEIRTFRDAHHLAHEATDHFVSLAAEAITLRGRFAVALSGGSTPRLVYGLLASQEFAVRVDWAGVHLFWGDERCVPSDHSDSNYRIVREVLVDPLSLPASNIHRMYGEIDPQKAADRYEEELRSFFAQDPGAKASLPRFDLVFLGLGPDGHTASLFPASEALGERKRWVAANYVDALRTWRLTLTPKIINAAGQVTFLVSGGRKAEILRHVLLEPRRPEKYPAQLIKPARGCLLWMIDVPAAEL